MKTHSIFIIIGISLYLLFTAETAATPYISAADWAKMAKLPAIRLPLPTVSPEEIQLRLTELTDQGYSYMFEYIQICDFLTVWQVSDTSSPDYGGMIEGESGELTTIIQTDNTQEAIRVWSHYGALSGDLQRYEGNIEAAWVYTMNFPAYSEEGETDYYRVHNCGWGLVAQMEYQDVYEDTTFREYADSCAQYMVTHPLSFTQGAPFYQELHPLVTGWAAGTLYQYGQYVNHQAYIDTALVFGSRVKAWIEENPNRLFNNERWAMSGGTAMWGIVESVFQEDSLAGAAWLGTYAPYMDVYAGHGAWNNSWNIWYSHAHRGIYDLLGDSLYQFNAVFLVDTLLFQDTDNDGGIPAGTMDPDSMDQTWVSCYADYMGIEKILNTLPLRDAGVAGFHYPREGVPIESGFSVNIMPLVANYGSSTIDSIWVYAQVPPHYTGQRRVQLSYLGMDSVLILPAWNPAGMGMYTITAFTQLPGDMNPANDTTYIEVEIRNPGILSGYVLDRVSGEGLTSWLYFYHQEVSDSIPYDSVRTNAAAGGHYSLSRMRGEYRVRVAPEIPYNPRDFHPVFIDTVSHCDFELTPAPVLLVDDDDNMNYERFLRSSLDSLGVDFYYWNRYQSGPLDGAATLFPNIIWMTGNDSTTTLETNDITELTAFLQAGGNLLLSGQNIGDDLGPNDPFLNDYLKVRHEADNVNWRFLDGVEGHPFASGTSLLLVGGTGAGNQNSPSSCLPLTGGEAAFYYTTALQPTAAVTFVSPAFGYRSVYMGFGIEAVSGLAQTNSRRDLLARIFEWWGYPTGVEPFPESCPAAFNLPPPYPNPFNPSTTVTYSIAGRGWIELSVYNLLGQKVATLWKGVQLPGQHNITWNGLSDFGAALGAGIYFCRLMTDNASKTQPIIILK